MAEYKLHGHILRDKQLFLRTYTFYFGTFTDRYFIDDGKIYTLHDDGLCGTVNFKMAQLTGPPTDSIEPLDEYYSYGCKPIPRDATTKYDDEPEQTLESSTLKGMEGIK